MGTPTAATNGTNHEYTILITPSDGMTIGELGFWVEDSHRANFTIEGATVQIVGTAGCLEATYWISQEYWSPGPTTATNACDPAGSVVTTVTSAMTLVLNTGSTSLVGHGYLLVLTYSGGSVTAGLP